MVTPPVSDKDESQDNPPEQLEDKEIEKIESFLNEKRIICSIKKALTIANLVGGGEGWSGLRTWVVHVTFPSHSDKILFQP